MMAFLLISHAQVFAAEQPPIQDHDKTGLVKCGQSAPGSKACTLVDLILTVGRIINFLLSWAWLVAVIFIVWAGWDLISAGGNEEGITKGKTALSNAIIGFFLIMVSFVLLNFIISILTGDNTFTTTNLIKSFELLPK